MLIIEKKKTMKWPKFKIDPHLVFIIKKGKRYIIYV